MPDFYPLMTAICRFQLNFKDFMLLLCPLPPPFFEQFCDLRIIFLNLRYLCNFCYYTTPMNFQIGHIEIFLKEIMATLIHFELVSNIFYNHLHVIQGDDCKNANKTSIRTHLSDIFMIMQKSIRKSH